MKRAAFHFSPELHVFLSPARQRSVFEYEFSGPQSVKHLIEAAGVPHTEVSRIQVNGAPKGFDIQIEDGDQVEIYSFLTTADHSPGNPHFILDNHLGKLASYLRMLGFDCLYSNSFQDDELARLSAWESRILLTRDHRLLMRKTVTHGYWLRSQDPDQQLQEVVKRYALIDLVRPFRRCMRCNAFLETVSKETILPRLQPLTQKYFDEFRLCPSCSQIYWQGSHYSKMLAFIKRILHDSSSNSYRTNT